MNDSLPTQGQEATKPAIKVNASSVQVNVPIGRFMDWEVRDARVSPEGSDIGVFRSRRWTETEVSTYSAAAERWERYGIPLTKGVQRLFRRRIRGGVIGQLCALRGVPVSEPPDRHGLIENVAMFACQRPVQIGADQ